MKEGSSNMQKRWRKKMNDWR